MATTVNHPTLGTIEFPSEMGDADIVAAIKKLETQAPAAAPAPAPVQATSAPASAFDMRGGMYGLGQDAATVGMSLPATANVVRYGGPMAVGLYTSPLGGAASVPLFSKIAGLIDDKDATPRELLGQMIMAATPFKSTGSFIGRAAVNVPTAMGFSELGLYAMSPDEYNIDVYKKPEANLETALRVAPAGIAGLGSLIGWRGKNIEDIGKAVTAIESPAPGAAASRLESIATLGGRKALLSDIFPAERGGLISSLLNPSVVERGALRAGNKNAIAQLEGAMANATDSLDVIRSQLDTRDLTEAMRSRLTLLKPLVEKQAASQQTAAKLAANAEKIRAENLPGLEAALKEAKQAALIAQTDNAIARLAKEQIFGKTVPDIRTFAPSLLVEEAQDIANQIKSVKSNYTNTLYTMSGVGQNDPVITTKELIKAVRSNPRVSNYDKDEFARVIRDRYTTVDEDGAKIFVDKTLSLAEYRAVRNELSKGYIAMGPNNVPVQKQFNEAAIYDSLTNTVNKNLQSTIPEAQYKAWIKANSVNSSLDDTVKGSLVDLLDKGDWKAVYDDLLTNGKSGLYKQVDGFVTTLNNAGEKVLASDILDKYNSFLSKGLLSKFTAGGSGMPGSIRSYDLDNLVKELQTLQNNKVNIQSLNVGPIGGADFRDGVKRLARLVDTKGNKITGYSPTEFNNWLKDVSEVGMDPAIARLQYRRAVRSQFLESTTGKKLTTAAKVSGLAKAAKIDAASQQAVIDTMLADDPLLALVSPSKDFAAGRRFNVNIDPTKNGNFVASIDAAPVEDLQALREALVKNGMTKELEQLQLSYVSNLFDPRVTGEATPNLKKIADNIIQSGYDKKLQALMTPDEYAMVKKNLINPVLLLNKSTQNILDPIPVDMNSLRAQIAAVNVTMGNQMTKGTLSTGSVITGGINLIRNKQYNVYHMLYLNPKTAPVFAAAGGNLNKFLQQPTMAVAYRLAQNKDQAVAEQAQTEPAR
jgi:hypothetical protein